MSFKRFDSFTFPDVTKTTSERSCLTFIPMSIKTITTTDERISFSFALLLLLTIFGFCFVIIVVTRRFFAQIALSFSWSSLRLLRWFCFHFFFHRFARFFAEKKEKPSRFFPSECFAFSHVVSFSGRDGSSGGAT